MAKTKTSQTVTDCHGSYRLLRKQTSKIVADSQNNRRPLRTVQTTSNVFKPFQTCLFLYFQLVSQSVTFRQGGTMTMVCLGLSDMVKIWEEGVLTTNTEK